MERERQQNDSLVRGYRCVGPSRSLASDETAILLTSPLHHYWHTCERQRGVQQNDSLVIRGEGRPLCKSSEEHALHTVPARPQLFSRRSARARPFTIPHVRRARPHLSRQLPPKRRFFIFCSAFGAFVLNAWVVVSFQL